MICWFFAEPFFCDLLWQKYRFLKNGIAGQLRLKGTSGDHAVQPLCSKQGQAGQVPWDIVQLDFEYLQRQRLHDLSG